MIRSPDNDKLKTIRKLATKRWREKLGLFVAEGEDLVAAAERAGWEPRFVLRAGEDVEPELLDAVSALGSGTRVIGVYEQRWAQPGGDLSVWLHGVEDPGNVGHDHPLGARARGRAGDPRPGLRRPVLAQGRAGDDGVAVRAPTGSGAARGARRERAWRWSPRASGTLARG